MAQEQGIPVCPGCGRLHYPGDYCPRRVARAILGRSRAALTQADHARLQKYIAERVDLVAVVEAGLVHGFHQD